MSSMVSEYIIRPALQQVRRFSRSSIASESESLPSPHERSRERPSSRDDAISETEEDSYFREEDDESASPPTSSQSSVTPNISINATHALSTESTAFDPSNSSVTRGPAHAFPEVGDPQESRARATSDESHTTDISMISAPPLEASSNIPSVAAEGTFPISTVADQHELLPEDDGMGTLRKRILGIQARKLPAPEQARLMHQLLMEGYKRAQVVPEVARSVTPSSTASLEQKQTQGRLDSFRFWHDLLGDAPTETFLLTEEDIRPVFTPLRIGEEESEYRALGCEHYRRNVKSQCSTCAHWYPCRFCHDKVENHPMIAKDTKHMLCMFCGTAQKVSEVCAHCSEPAAMYYCSICKLWNNDPDRSIYHCPDCGICRVGRGLGRDFFHCKTCNACLNINLENSHRCIERLLDCDCPICGEYMFNTPRGICHMKCGHTLHKDCWSEHIKHGYKCPICNKSVVNMETQFRRLDLAIETQPMPEKFQDTKALVSCNDCSAKTTVKYHWLGLKCAVCQSYNTSQVQILGADPVTLEEAASIAPEAQMPDSLVSGNVDMLYSTQGSTVREIPRRRRHSSNLMELSIESLDPRAPIIGSYTVQDRLARSVSPITPAVPVRPSDLDDSDDDREDMIGIWSRIPRSITSNEDHEAECDSDDESISSQSENDMEEDEDDEEDDDAINLFGHR